MAGAAAGPLTSAPCKVRRNGVRAKRERRAWGGVDDPVSAFFGIYNLQDASAVYDIFSTDYVGTINGKRVKGPDEARLFFEEFLKAFPDCMFAVEDRVEDGSGIIAARWWFEASHDGEWLGHAASGRRVTSAGMTFFHVRQGRIFRLWGMWDVAGLLAQIS